MTSNSKQKSAIPTADSPIHQTNYAADLLALSHIFNGVASAAGAALGYLTTARYEHLPINGFVLLAAFVATLCISNAGFIVNDIIDLPIDRINRPDRPLAAGRVSVQTAWVLYATYNIIGILLAWFVSAQTGILAALIAVGLYLYSLDLKKRFLIGHILIGIMGAVLMPFGGVAAGSTLLFYSAPITFAAFFAREVLKTVPDAEGDRTNGVDNITTRYGERTAIRVSQMMFAVCAIAIPMLRAVISLNNWFLLLCFVVIWPLAGFFILQLQRNTVEQQINLPKVHLVLRLSKLLFLLVAAAILIGTL
jgi:geranylgeranylglycerol-phosphate geranylgeranyltransferase